MVIPEDIGLSSLVGTGYRLLLIYSTEGEHMKCAGMRVKSHFVGQDVNSQQRFWKPKFNSFLSLRAPGRERVELEMAESGGKRELK